MVDTHDMSQQSAESGNMPVSASELHALVLQSLDDDQAQDIVSIALEGKTSIADHMIVASGRSSRQVASIAQKLAERIKKAGRNARLEGLTTADWVLIDAEDVIIHLFRPEVRSFYNLERMWGMGEGSESPDMDGADADGAHAAADNAAAG